MTPVRLSELAAALGLPREGEADVELTGAAGIADAGPGDITFVGHRRFERFLADTRAGAVILRPGVPSPKPCLRAADPQAAFAAVLARFAPPRERIFPPGVHPTAVVDTSAVVGAGVSIGPYAVVGAGAVLGEGCALGAHAVVMPDAVVGPRSTLYPHAVVREGCRLGAEVILHAGAVVGSDGFGYVPGPGGLLKIPQIGRAVLGDRVEIGANACVDRAQTAETLIGEGTKIDNLVQIGHNVRIGRDCALSAQVGISGSSRLGDRAVLGGQVGVADHLTLGNDVRIGAQSGLDRDVPDGSLLFGTPAIEHKRAFRLIALLHRLPELFDRVKRLEAGGSSGGAGAGERERS